MTEKEITKELKIKALQLYNQDGVIDIISGVVLFNFGLDLINQNEATSIFTWIPVLLIASIKDKITNQRLSPDQLGADDKSIRYWTFFPAVGLILAITLFGTLILDDPFGIKNLTVPPFSGNTLSLFGSLLLALTCIIAEILTGLKRFFIYAAAAFAAGLVSYFFLPIYFPFFLTAAVMLALGIRLMYSFTKTYPQKGKDETDEN
ncbi:MAG: hypothetical protein Q7J07_09290 [Pelolinea sp.]|nr:hypothetical protein [Pelolinea sp.]